MKEKPDILAVIEPYVTLRKAGRNFRGLCPFHSEKTPSFTVSPSRQTFHCFGCGSHGDVISFIQKVKNLSFWEALDYLGMNGGSYKPDPRETIKRDLVKVFRAWCDEYYDDLCILYRTLQKAKLNVKTEPELTTLEEFYHGEPSLLHKIEILQGDSDIEKFNLYKEEHGI